MRTRLALSVCVVMVLASSCSWWEDKAYIEETLALAPDVFEARVVESQAIARNVSQAQVQQDWINGADAATLDSPEAAMNAWYDWSTDFCSNVPDTGGTFDFKQACARHDFGWRNLKHLDIRWMCPGASGDPDPDLAQWCGSTPFGDRGLPEGQVGIVFYTTNNKLWVNEIFYSDMLADCIPRNFLAELDCRSVALAYKAGVDAVA